MQVFRCGDEATVRARLAQFIEEMDDRGEPFDTPGDGTADCEPNVLTRTHGITDVDGGRRVWLVLTGRVWVSGSGGKRALLGPGEGVYWEANEESGVEVEQEPVAYLNASGPALTAERFAV